MSNLKYFDIINPYKKEDISDLEKFCNKYNQQLLYSEITKLNQNIIEQDYLKLKEAMIVVDELYCQRNKREILALSKVTVSKDIKRAQIEIYKTGNDCKNFVISLAQYLLQDINLEDVYILVEKEDKDIMNSLIENGFIPLISEGENERCIPFLLEKELIKESRIHI